MTGDWPPKASAAVLQARARLMAQVRAFFAERGVLEVETPLLAQATATDPHLESFRVEAEGRFLQTSPEAHMKRLLAAGSGPIYQVCKAFRRGEAGPQHNPEFTLLEWYRPGWDHLALMEEVEALLTALLPRPLAPAERLSYAQAFARHAGLDPHEAGEEALAEVAAARGLVAPAGLDRAGWLDFIMSHLVVPALGQGRLSFVYDFPADQAAQARVRPGAPPLAERFEVFYAGRELGNGYHELRDAAEMARRMERDLERRRALGRDPVPRDRRLLAALEAGLPRCAGVALGLDRVLQCALGAPQLDAVLAFPWARA